MKLSKTLFWLLPLFCLCLQCFSQPHRPFPEHWSFPPWVKTRPQFLLPGETGLPLHLQPKLPCGTLVAVFKNPSPVVAAELARRRQMSKEFMSGYGKSGFYHGVISFDNSAQIMQSRLFTLSLLQAHARAEEARRKTASVVSGSSMSSSQTASTSRRPIRKPSGNKLRTFTYKDGEEIQARLLSIDPRGSQAKIKTAKGLTYNVPVTQFSEDDVGFLRSWWEERNPRARHQFGKAVTGL